MSQKNAMPQTKTAKYIKNIFVFFSLSKRNSNEFAITIPKKGRKIRVLPGFIPPLVKDPANGPAKNQNKASAFKKLFLLLTNEYIPIKKKGRSAKYKNPKSG